MTEGALEIARPWPPVYDDESLEAAIKHAVTAMPKQFYVDVSDGAPCQGDIVELPTDVPVLDEDGDPSTDGTSSYWLVAANTCDMARAFENNPGVTYVAITPLIVKAELGVTGNVERDLHEYRLNRMFYVPPWAETVEPHVADFTRFVSVHRDALRKRATVRARMCLESWIVLNACLVRLLCREDGRHTQLDKLARWSAAAERQNITLAELVRESVETCIARGSTRQAPAVRLARARLAKLIEVAGGVQLVPQQVRTPLG